MRNCDHIESLKKLKIIVICIMMIGIHHSYGQDVSFSQFYTNPLYLNPAFAGSVGVPRVSLQYRNQWHKFDNAYSTYSAAFDFPVKALQGGIGLHLMNDTQADNIVNSFQIDLAYSVFLQLSKEYRIHAGLQTGYHQNSLNVGGLVFADNLDINYGNHGTTAEIISDPNYGFVDFSTGLLIYSKRLFFGGAVHHLTEPNQTYFGNDSNGDKLYRKYTAHVGARLPIFRHGYHRKTLDISPQIIVQKQGISEQINYGMFATKRGLTAGAWLRQNFGIRYDSVIFLFGYVNSRMQITYSFDWTVSGLRGDSGGISELSLAFLLKKVDKKRIFPFFRPYEDEFGVQ
ncbi:PorP/SprF family type IX secretion system membrane protein [Sunxiuqinia sp. A32]|uniref:PorP/SprF family type IX secretion system membrane protein n=1 Tax=Sunxiuqinia sp. A32 TaxID=3461496 RepID=UPI0040468453